MGITLMSIPKRPWFLWLQEDHYLAHEEAQSSLSDLGRKILDSGRYQQMRTKIEYSIMLDGHNKWSNMIYLNINMRCFGLNLMCLQIHVDGFIAALWRNRRRRKQMRCHQRHCHLRTKGAEDFLIFGHAARANLFDSLTLPLRGTKGHRFNSLIW